MPKKLEALEGKVRPFSPSGSDSSLPCFLMVPTTSCRFGLAILTPRGEGHLSGV